MLFAWFSVAQKLSEQINDVEKMMSHFKDITDPMANLLTRLGSVGSKIAPFAELAFSVGSLVAGTLHVAGHTESDEYKALMLLNATTTVQFKKNEETVRLSQKLLDGGLQMGVYNREIRDQLDILHSEMKMMWNPNLDKTQAVVNVFKHTCLQRNPKDLLLVIHGMTVRGCHRLPTRRDVQILAEARQVFRDIKLYNVINIAYTMHHIKSQFEEDKESVIATLQAHSNSSDELLEEIKWAFTSKVWKLEDAMKMIKQVFANRRITVKPTNCLTRTMVEATNYRYLEAMEFSDLLIKDMARAVSCFCWFVCKLDLLLPTRLATYENPTTGMVTEGNSKWIFTMAKLGGQI
uniref:Vitellogenin n=1 Tax=Ditylenchus dipsaci TaxID=166011 RepID=A0A915CNB7_9BILA